MSIRALNFNYAVIPKVIFYLILYKSYTILLMKLLRSFIYSFIAPIKSESYLIKKLKNYLNKTKLNSIGSYRLKK